MKLAHRFLLLAIMLVLIGIGMERGKHLEPLMVRDGLAIAPDGMVDTINHESAHARAEARVK